MPMLLVALTCGPLGLHLPSAAPSLGHGRAPPPRAALKLEVDPEAAAAMLEEFGPAAGAGAVRQGRRARVGGGRARRAGGGGSRPAAPVRRRGGAGQLEEPAGAVVARGAREERRAGGRHRAAAAAEVDARRGDGGALRRRLQLPRVGVGAHRLPQRGLRRLPVVAGVRRRQGLPGRHLRRGVRHAVDPVPARGAPLLRGRPARHDRGEARRARALPRRGEARRAAADADRRGTSTTASTQACSTTWRTSTASAATCRRCSSRRPSCSTSTRRPSPRSTTRSSLWPSAPARPRRAPAAPPPRCAPQTCRRPWSPPTSDASSTRRHRGDVLLRRLDAPFVSGRATSRSAS